MRQGGAAVNKRTQRPGQGELRLMSGSRGGQSDARIVSHGGSASNDSDAIQTRALDVVHPADGPKKADLAQDAEARDQRPGRGPVWGCVGTTRGMAS